MFGKTVRDKIPTNIASGGEDAVAEALRGRRTARRLLLAAGVKEDDRIRRLLRTAAERKGWLCELNTIMNWNGLANEIIWTSSLLTNSIASGGTFVTISTSPRSRLVQAVRRDGEVRRTTRSICAGPRW